MELLTVMRIAVGVSAAFAIIGLLALLAGARSMGIKPVYARPSGSAARGVMYALFRGMLPWEKESVAKHLPTFVAGLFYHAGIFMALLSLVLTMTKVLPSDIVLQPMRVLITVGLACGLGLLIKRFALAKMRLLSTADDALANLLVDLFLAAALAASLLPRFESFFLTAAIALFIYVPLGKIRHCVFFFFTRVIFGVHFGRRGVLPPSYGERGAK